MGRVFASADWHGCGELANKVFKFLNPDDTLYFLGDSVDRGPDGVKILQTLMSDPRVKMIKGNHEEMLREALPYIRAEVMDINEYHGDKFALWYENGGRVTGEDLLLNYSPNQMLEFIKFLNNLPTELRYKSPKGHTVIMEHAGYTPFAACLRKNHNPLWDREHFHDKWTFRSTASEKAKNTYLVHGHTPVQYLKYEYTYKGQESLTKEEKQHKYDWWKEENQKIMIPKVIRYCDGHKFCVDLCTIVSNRIALLDLDTFEAIYFDAD